MVATPQKRVMLRLCRVPDCPCFAAKHGDYCQPHQRMVERLPSTDPRTRPVLVRDDEGLVVRILV